MEVSDERVEEVPSDVKGDIKEFLRLDDGLKQARLDMKESRDALNAHREHIIEYMRSSETPRLSARKGDVTLILQEKEQKIRPEASVIKSKLQELLQQGVSDPERIWEEIDKCGGTKTVWKLARRSKRKPSEKKKVPKAKRQKADA
jgi:hypothetical protein